MTSFSSLKRQNTGKATVVRDLGDAKSNRNGATTKCVSSALRPTYTSGYKLVDQPRRSVLWLKKGVIQVLSLIP